MDFGTLRAAVLAAAILSIPAACAPVPVGPTDLPRMDVRSFFDIRHLCSLGVSPPIELDRAPTAAARYRIRFANTSVLYAPPSDFEVAAAGPAIPEDGIEGYRGPCPGETQSFAYRIEVLALDARGSRLAYGQTTVVATSTTRLMRQRPEQRPQMPKPGG